MKLRLPEAVKAAIAKAANENSRSMNAEIVARLEQTLGFEDKYGKLEDVMENVWGDIESLREQVEAHREALEGLGALFREGE